jgi:hypothetical protein
MDYVRACKTPKPLLDILLHRVHEVLPHFHWYRVETCMLARQASVTRAQTCLLAQPNHSSASGQTLFVSVCPEFSCGALQRRQEQATRAEFRALEGSKSALVQSSLIPDRMKATTSGGKSKSRASRSEDDYGEMELDATPHPNTVTNASNAYKGLPDGRDVLPFALAEKLDNAIAATKVRTVEPANLCARVAFTYHLRSNHSHDRCSTLLSHS